MKTITFVVPCYNSAAYMDACIETILPGGSDIEIILVDDGSTDKTPALCDEYAARFPDIVRVIHQENGGHGEGINQGLRNAEGLFFKVVDSDDWIDKKSLSSIIDFLKDEKNADLDLLVCNYIYEHINDGTQKAVRYANVFPPAKNFAWDDTRQFRLSQYLLMHSVIYRTKMLRDCSLVLPKHTFYVDNIFVYHPLPFVKKLYYMDIDFYHYTIGREGQSVAENIMVGRADQQLRITKLMIEAHDLYALKSKQPKLARYMMNYIAMMISISSVLLLIKGSEESLKKREALWEYLRGTNKPLYYKMRYRSISVMAQLPGSFGCKLSIMMYRLAKKLYRFN